MARSEMACLMEARVMTAPDRACVRLSDALSATRVWGDGGDGRMGPRPDARGLETDAPARGAACLPVDVAIG